MSAAEPALQETCTKVVHYCWFGGASLGVRELACIDSWKRYLPDYEIRRWDESNFDVSRCPYAREAYEAKKWAFVSDYARFCILHSQGGVYFDTDVELIASLDDILARGPFMGFETDAADLHCGGEVAGAPAVAGAHSLAVNPGLGLAAYPGIDLYREIVASYERDHFLRPDGTYDQTTVVRRVTGILLDHGLQPVSGVQEVAGVSVYPAEYFNPKSYDTGRIVLTENTRSIHHFSMSWLTRSQRFEHEVARWLRGLGLKGKAVYRIAALACVLRFAEFGRIAHKLRGR